MEVEWAQRRSELLTGTISNPQHKIDAFVNFQCMSVPATMPSSAFADTGSMTMTSFSFMLSSFSKQCANPYTRDQCGRVITAYLGEQGGNPLSPSQYTRHSVLVVGKTSRDLFQGPTDELGITI